MARRHFLLPLLAAAAVATVTSSVAAAPATSSAYYDPENDQQFQPPFERVGDATLDQPFAAPLLAAPRQPAGTDPVSAVQALVTRRLGAGYASAFTFVLIPADNATQNDVFELSPGPTIKGNTGVAMSAGLGWYLKYTLNASWTWGRNGTGFQLSTLPAPGSPLPDPLTPGRFVSPVRLRYYSNVCTLSYTYWYWGWQEWLEELDRFALWGINLPLALTGSEKVWLQLWTKFGVSQADALSFFGGSAFLAWQRMGNMDTWGGPMDLDFIENQYNLQTLLLAQMREMGMSPVLPGFGGHVPAALVPLFPGHNFTKSSIWCGFNVTWLLDPSDPLYASIGQSFYQLLSSTYGLGEAGQPHYYSTDVFNEQSPSTNDPTYLREINLAIYSAMSAVDPDAIYTSQGWLYFSDPGFWTPAAVKAFLSGVPSGKMLILDLYSDFAVTAWRYDSYYGVNWVWNMLQIFGGRRGVYGNMVDVANGPPANRTAAGSSMVGIGATPEAVEMTPVTFDLLFEMGWRAEAPSNLTQWVGDYSVRRYGKDSPTLRSAWATLLETQYSRPSSYGLTEQFCFIENSPGLDFDTSQRLNDPDGIPIALRAFLAAAAAGEVNATLPQFRYDLIDLARQLICNVFSDLAILGGRAYQRFQFNNVNSSASVLPTQAALVKMINDLDALLSTDVNFMMGPRLQDAYATATTPAEVAARDFNFKNQITLWGPDGEINDYAAKNGWSGLVGDYYGGRWSLHADYLTASVLSGQQVDWTAYTNNLTTFQWNFNINANNTVYPVQPSGDAVAQATAILTEYATASSPSHYTVLQNTDAPPPSPGVVVDIFQPWNRDPAVLQRLCDLDPTCLGFILPEGWLKNGTSNRVATPGVDLWLKQSTV